MATTYKKPANTYTKPAVAYKAPATAAKYPTAKKTTTTSAKAPVQDNWISRSVQNVVAGAGSMVGGVINAAGNGVSAAGRGVGDSIIMSASKLSGGVNQYGNNIKDATKAQGPRAPTAQNPLGLSGTPQAARAQFKHGGQKKAIGGAGNNPLGLK